MGLYKNTNGVLTPVAGRGKAEYGASTVRTGTITYTSTIPQGSYANINVTFSEPMPDADYEVIYDYNNSSGHSELVNAGCFATFAKTKNGFTCSISAPTTGVISGWSIRWKAFKLYTDNEYNNILAAMPSDASSSNKLLAANSIVDSVADGNMKAITSNAVCDFLKVKNKVISEGITIQAGKYVSATDATLANKIFCGYTVYNVASYNVSITQAYINNGGANITIKNNGSSDITTGQITVYYMG